MKPKPRIRILTLGCAETGKTTLIKRFCDNQFDKRYEPTIGVDYGSTNTKIILEDVECDVCVDIFDSSGHDEYFEVRNEFYRDVDGILLVFDVNDFSTFESLEKLLMEGKNNGLDYNKTIIVVCGNKSDLDMQQVTIQDGLTYAERLQHSFYFETSALNGKNVVPAFHCIITSWMSKKAK